MKKLNAGQRRSSSDSEALCARAISATAPRSQSEYISETCETVQTAGLKASHAAAASAANVPRRRRVIANTRAAAAAPPTAERTFRRYAKLPRGTARSARPTRTKSG